MVDLHTHILPNIDDGASDLGESEELLRQEFSEGVTRLFLTPHFYPSRDNLQEFLENRARALKSLKSIWVPGEMPEIRTGAEVHYSTELLNMDLSELTLGDTRYLLLELPYRRFPSLLEPMIRDLVMMGLTPILAHLERYPYFYEEPSRIAPYVRLGALGQINAEAILNRKTRSFAVACLKKSLVHVIASDTHDTVGRKPSLKSAMSIIGDMENESIKQFWEMIWANEEPPYIDPGVVKKIFGMFY